MAVATTAAIAATAATAATAESIVLKKEANVLAEQKLAAKDAQELVNALPMSTFCAVCVNFRSAFTTRFIVHTSKEYIEIKPKITNVNQEPVCCVYDAQSQLVPSFGAAAMWRSPDVLMTMERPLSRRHYPATLENGLIVPTTWDYRIVTFP